MADDRYHDTDLTGATQPPPPAVAGGDLGAAASSTDAQATAPLDAPFPWFGGKRGVASVVWDALGDVAHYVEPFFGSGAVLLSRPHTPGIETVNDADGFLINFWRAVAAEPDAVAVPMDWPVSEIDLTARHRALCRMPDKQAFLDRMRADPEYYDVRRAAWWCWGLCQWIGRGWCEGEWWPDDPERSRGTGMSGGKRPTLSSGQGVHRQRPHLGHAGIGVHRSAAPPLVDWMQALADRLRRVRVCCGDWSRVCTDGATAHGSTVGVFLDPPYAHASGRDESIYRCDHATVADDVRRWCIERTDQTRYRIVLAGYEGEHDELEPRGWRVHAWKANGGYGNTGNGAGRENRTRERLWISPSCEREEPNLYTLQD